MEQNNNKPSKWWAIVIGAGIALSPIHNLWLTDLATNSQGESLFFLPAFGYLLLIMGTGLFLLYHWSRVKETGWGDKRIISCLLLIVLAIALSGANYTGWQDKVAPLGMGLVLFATYLMARTIGREALLPLATGAGIASAGVIASAIANPGVPTGGVIFNHSLDCIFVGRYDPVAGYVIIGTAVFIHRYQWILASLSMLAMFLSGSPEGIFAVAVITVVLLSRKDWGKKLMLVVLPTIVAAVVWFSIGWGQELYSFTEKTATLQPRHATTETTEVQPPKPDAPPEEELSPFWHSAVGFRLAVIIHTMSNIRPLGEGYMLTDFSRSRNVHNVPLVLVQQLGYPGILAGIAWLYVTIWCLIKTRWKYAWVSILALSVWDHYVWTQLAPWWWVIVGASMTSKINSDLIF